MVVKDLLKRSREHTILMAHLCRNLAGKDESSAYADPLIEEYNALSSFAGSMLTSPTVPSETKELFLKYLSAKKDADNLLLSSLSETVQTKERSNDI